MGRSGVLDLLCRLPEDGTPVPKDVGVILIMNCVLWFVFYCILLTEFVDRHIELILQFFTNLEHNFNKHEVILPHINLCNIGSPCSRTNRIFDTKQSSCDNY